jgi:hypothetical protein
VVLLNLLTLPVRRKAELQENSQRILKRLRIWHRPLFLS